MRYVAPMLSHQRRGGVEDTSPSSDKREQSQIISVEACATARYSDSVLERETVRCFLDVQEMRLRPRNRQ